MLVITASTKQVLPSTHVFGIFLHINRLYIVFVTRACNWYQNAINYQLLFKYRRNLIKGIVTRGRFPATLWLFLCFHVHQSLKSTLKEISFQKELILYSKNRTLLVCKVKQFLPELTFLQVHSFSLICKIHNRSYLSISKGFNKIKKSMFFVFFFNTKVFKGKTNVRILWFCGNLLIDLFTVTPLVQLVFVLFFHSFKGQTLLCPFWWSTIVSICVVGVTPVFIWCFLIMWTGNICIHPVFPDQYRWSLHLPRHVKLQIVKNCAPIKSSTLR